MWKASAGFLRERKTEGWICPMGSPFIKVMMWVCYKRMTKG